MLQCVAVCCSVLQCVAVCCRRKYHGPLMIETTNEQRYYIVGVLAKTLTLQKKLALAKTLAHTQSLEITKIVSIFAKTLKIPIYI